MSAVMAVYTRTWAWAGCVAYLGWVGNAKACVLGISKKQTPAPFFVYDYLNSKTKTAESEESIGTKTKYMFKNIIFAAILLGVSVSVAAQEKIEEKNASQTEIPGNIVVDAEYQAIDGGSGYGLNISCGGKNGGLVLKGAITSGKTNSDITKNEGWNIGIGYGYRYWFNKMFFVEGQAGVGYYHGTVEMRYEDGVNDHYSVALGHYTTTKYSKKKDSNGEFGCFFQPRIGVNIAKGYGLFAGYNWDFIKFKFNKDYTSDYFSVGMIAVF